MYVYLQSCLAAAYCWCKCRGQKHSPGLCGPGYSQLCSRPCWV